MPRWLKFLLHLNRAPSNQSTLNSLLKLQKVILETLDFNKVVENSVNGVLTELGYLKLGYRIIVLALLNESSGTLDRVAISQTTEARKALELTPVPFRDIRIPLHEIDNICIKAIKDLRSYSTRNWFDILRPLYTPQQAIQIQQAIGIKTSVVYPIFYKGFPKGVLIFSLTKNEEDMSESEKELIKGLTDLVGLAVENATLYTSLDKAKIELEQANEKLRKLDKLKDDFVSIASHELRTPMTAIRSYVWMALNKSDVTLSEKMKRYLSRTLISTERLINLVNDMLNVSRIEGGRIEIDPKPVDLITLAGEVIDEVRAKADEKKVKLFVLNHPNIPQAFADVDKVHQVFLNLIGNSLKFTPAEGSITVDFFSDGQVVEVRIKDTGIGISKDDLSHLFQKFGRLENSYVSIGTSGGTGLGLYISKNLIELMHGKIWAVSEGTGSGATFTFSLPVASVGVLKDGEKYHIRPVGEAKELEPAVV